MNENIGSYRTLDGLLTRHSPIVFFVFGFVTVVLLAYLLLVYRYDEKNILDDYDKLENELADGSLESLLNGSGINNIPKLNIISSNPEVTTANRCASGPVYIGPGIGSDTDCIRTCVNDTAHVVNVREGETVVFDKTVLQKGAHCVIGPRPECNMRTSIAMMTVNSVTCQSRFPRLVGGRLGDTVVACNDNIYNDPQNVLWDYKTNTRFDPWTTTVLDEDERLSDGSFRFVCHYNGEDSRGNLYQPHPYDRYHPIRNHCASLVYRAHPAVKTVWNDDSKTFTCDCGDRSETRVSHIDANDPTSVCSNIVAGYQDDGPNRRRLTIPYRCFTLFSTLDDVAESFPCPNDQFTRKGSQMASVELVVTESNDVTIEHPEFKKFPVNGKTSVKNHFVING